MSLSTIPSNISMANVPNGLNNHTSPTSTTIPYRDSQEAIGFFDAFGNKNNSTTEESQKKISKHIDTYFKEGNTPKKGIGLWALVGAYEAILGITLSILQKSPATFTNAATSCGEFVQTLIGGSNLPKFFRQKGIASVVTLAGGLGITSWFKEIKDLIKGEGEELKDLSLFQKVGLSIGSLVCSGMMFIGALEKSSMAPLVKEKNGGERAEEIELNGNNDIRCTVEWGLMALYLWASKIKPFKVAVDLLLPLNALQDGLRHLFDMDKFWTGGIEEKLKKVLGNKPTNLIAKLLGLNKEEKIPSFLFKSWWFGKKEGEGIRSKLLPMFKLFGTTPPICHLNKDNQLVVKVPALEAKLCKQPTSPTLPKTNTEPIANKLQPQKQMCPVLSPEL